MFVAHIERLGQYHCEGRREAVSGTHRPSIQRWQQGHALEEILSQLPGLRQHAHCAAQAVGAKEATA